VGENAKGSGTKRGWPLKKACVAGHPVKRGKDGIGGRDRRNGTLIRSLDKRRERVDKKGGRPVGGGGLGGAGVWERGHIGIHKRIMEESKERPFKRKKKRSPKSIINRNVNFQQRSLSRRRR